MNLRTGMTRIGKRLEAAERAHEKTRRLHVIWAEWDDTVADLKLKRDRMIAEGRASPGDKFVHVGWERPQNTDPGGGTT